MKKRFLPFLMAVLVLGQFAIADNGGHYVPRTQPTMDAESFMGSLRANQNTGLIDPADMFKAMQAPAMKNAANDPLYWINMGPDNMGGQTMAVVYDNQSNVVYIGSKGGGVFKSYNNGTTWHQVGKMNLMVSCMVQTEDGVIYVGTGDGGDNVNHNGLSQQGYDNSFIGTGIWAINTKNNDAMEQVVAPTEEEWLYINDIATVGINILAATTEGLKYSDDKGHTWHLASYIDENGEAQPLDGNAAEIRIGGENTIVASVGGQIFIGKDITKLVCHSGTTNQFQEDTLLPKAAGLLDVAISKDEKAIYASCIDANGNHAGVFLSQDKGATWTKVLPNVGSDLGHTIYDGKGLYNHGITIDPSDDGIVYVTGYKLWRLQRPATGTGFYLCEAITSNTMISSPAYLHVGLHTMVFNPKNANEYYIGTDGGVYRGNKDFMFFNCNRNYVTTRMFNVAYSGRDERIMAAGLDHGTVLIEGTENTNTPGTGLWINPSGDNMGMFGEGSSAGPCAFSMINHNTIFVTYQDDAGADGTKAVIARSETAGEDWVSTNFLSGLSYSTTSFRLPFVLIEDYDADWNPATVWCYNTTEDTLKVGEIVECLSNCNYPFDYELEAELVPGDSVEVHDPIAAKLYLTFTDALYVTLTPLNFGVESAWYKISGKQLLGYTGEPLSMGLSADGDDLFVGFKNGKLFRISNLNTVVDANTGTYTTTALDSLNHTITILNPDCQVTTTAIELPMSGQCVTSVSVDPRDANKVIVTCGNYGNENYVFYSTNALSENPVFTSVQGNLPKMPVYSSLIEMKTGDVIIGTERGIYRTKDIASAEWNADSHMLGEVPVMDLKQQRFYVEDKETVEETQDGLFITEYPGVHNTGVIYAATYGRGVFRCENYKKEFLSVPETPAMAESITVSMYPNPVQGEATVSFNATANTNVNFQVFDLTGRMVMSQNMGRFTEGEQEFRINTESLSTGSYILRLNQDGNSSCVKFMVY